MLYDIVLKIDYSYEDYAAGGRHVLRLFPADIPNVQRVISGYLNVSPKASERFDRRDFFGNSVTEVAYYDEHPEVSFKVKARVERLATTMMVQDVSPTLLMLAQEIKTYNSLDPTAPHHFLGPSSRIRLNSVLSDYGYEQTSGATSVAEIVEHLGLALHRDMQFDPKATTVETMAEDAFAKRRGVCQDFTHIMIACLRGMGVPAGYTSGFLRTNPPEGQEKKLEGADAMHAWVRAWAGNQMGWVEYDPTNAMFVGPDHIVVAYGRDYGDVAPIKGVLKTAGDQKSKQAVDVIPVMQS